LPTLIFLIIKYNKMKLRTDRKTYFGKEKQFENTIVKFDNFGVSNELEDKEGQHLLKVYSHALFSVNDSKFDTKKAYLEEKNVENTVQNLQTELDKKDVEIETLKGRLTSTEANLKEWKELFDINQKEKDEAVSKLTELEISYKYELEDLKYKLELTNKTNDELKTVCGILNIPKEKTDGKKKDEIIKLILIESKK